MQKFRTLSTSHLAQLPQLVSETLCFLKRVGEAGLGLVQAIQEYEPGTWGPSEAETLTAGMCSCDSPVWLIPTAQTENQTDECLEQSPC